MIHSFHSHVHMAQVLLDLFSVKHKGFLWAQAFCSASPLKNFLFAGDAKAELSDKNLQLKETTSWSCCVQTADVSSQPAQPFLLFLMF